MKTIGILGGLGPQATMDLEVRIHAVAQQLLPRNGNQGYPPLLVYYHRGIPVVADENGVPVQPIQLDPRLRDAACWLGAKADFLLIASNGIHRLADELAAAAGKPVLSMIEATVREVQRRRWRSVGVLTFIEPIVYQQPLSALGIRCEVLSAERQELLDTVPRAVSAGTAGAAEAAIVQSAVEHLRSRGVDGVILGCTEFPLALGSQANAPDLINPIPLLAEAAVRCATA
jgi:aspartate racemase